MPILVNKSVFVMFGLQVTTHSWRGENVQIDLLLDRSDRTVDICEIKCTEK